MTAGLPGAGIGGLFYLLAALLSPLVELFRACGSDGGSRRWPFVLRHFLLAIVICSAIGLTGWLIGVVAGLPSLVAPAVGGGVDPGLTQVIGRRMAFLTVATLAFVLGTVELLHVGRAVLVRRARQATAPLPPRKRGALAPPSIASAEDAA